MTDSRQTHSESWRFTIDYTRDPDGDGWVTAQIVEYPAAISQGIGIHEARTNVLSALCDIWRVDDDAL